MKAKTIFGRILSREIINVILKMNFFQGNDSTNGIAFHFAYLIFPFRIFTKMLNPLLLLGKRNK